MNSELAVPHRDPGSLPRDISAWNAAITAFAVREDGGYAATILDGGSSSVPIASFLAASVTAIGFTNNLLISNWEVPNISIPPFPAFRDQQAAMTSAAEFVAKVMARQVHLSSPYDNATAAEAVYAASMSESVPPARIVQLVKDAVARAREFTELSDRLKRFLQLPKDWGGPQTAPISKRTVDLAKMILLHLPLGVRLPQATASGDGEIVLTWVKGGDRLNATIDSDDNFTWFSRVGGHVVPGGELTIPPNNLVPSFNKALVDFYR